MLKTIKHSLAKNVADESLGSSSYNINKLSSLLHFVSIQKNTQIETGVISVSNFALATHFKNKSIEKINSKNEVYLNTQSNKNHLLFHLPPSLLNKAVLTDINKKEPPFSNYHSDHEVYLPNLSKLKFLNKVIEFSSPNIAKPFHSGHLRSTVIGQFLVNINKYFNQSTNSINYLGDWGTQFGYLAEGFKRYGSFSSQENLIPQLLKVYVEINKQKKTDPHIHIQAKQFFSKLEKGDKKAREFWEMCRRVSIEEYNSLYQKLRISFDDTLSESMYSKEVEQLIQQLQQNQLLNEKDGVKTIDVTLPGDPHPTFASLLKPDGSSLYLSRDIASAIDRMTKYKANNLYYVVDRSQEYHFKLLKRSLNKMGIFVNDDLHVKFGRVEKMSTRTGSGVLLREVVKEASIRILERMKERDTTKVNKEDIEKISEELAISAVITDDLKQSRMNDYTFSWSNALNFNGDTGLFLQYTHARLYNLLESTKNYEVNNFENINFELLVEPIVVKVTQHLASFEDVLIKAYYEKEACHVIHFLFKLGRLVNLAHPQLRILDQPKDIAAARYIFFQSILEVMKIGLNIINIKPLNQI